MSVFIPKLGYCSHPVLKCQLAITVHILLLANTHIQQKLPMILAFLSILSLTSDVLLTDTKRGSFWKRFCFAPQDGSMSWANVWRLRTSTAQWAARRSAAPTSLLSTSPSAAWQVWALGTSAPTLTPRRSSPSAPCSSVVRLTPGCLSLCVSVLYDSPRNPAGVG